MGVSLSSMLVPSGFGGNAGFDINALVPSLGCADSYLSVAGGAGDGRARARPKQQVGLALCSVTVTALIQVRFDPKLLE